MLRLLVASVASLVAVGVVLYEGVPGGIEFGRRTDPAINLITSLGTRN